MKCLVQVYLQLQSKNVKTESLQIGITKNNNYNVELNKLLEYCTECVAIRKVKLGVNNMAVVSALNIVAFLSMKLQKFNDAENAYLEVVKFRQEILGNTHLDTMSAMSNLAILYFQKEQYNKALPMFITILDNMRQQQQQNNISDSTSNEYNILLVAISNLANTYYNLSNHTQAETLYEELIQLVDKTKKTSNTSSCRISNEDNLEIDIKQIQISENHPAYLNACTNLANIFYRKKEYIKAEPFYLKCVNIRQTILGTDHQDTLSSMKNLGVLYFTMQKYDLAQTQFISCLQGRRKLLENNHPDTLLAMSYLANIYNNKQEYDLAEPLYEEYSQLIKDNFTKNTKKSVTAALVTEIYDDVSIVVVNNLGILYFKKKLYNQAQPLLEIVVEYKKSKLGLDNANTIAVYSNLGAVYKVTKQYVLAQQVYQIIYEYKKKTLGDDHADTKAALKTINDIKKELGD